MNAEIITVGTELLLGDILNSNSQFLSRELAEYGINTLYHSTVGDNPERLEQTLRLALSRADMVIMTGGLGPTEDDLTRAVTARTLELPLELHEASAKRIRDYFEMTGKPYTNNNEKQAMLPKGCVVFPNDHGTAAGCAVETNGHYVILLPGPPSELVPMFNEYVAPYLSRFSKDTIRSHWVGIFGLPEATVDERLADMLAGENPTVAPYAKNGEVSLRVTSKAGSVAEADALCRPLLDEIRERLGSNVYGIDSGNLQKTVVALLSEKQKKIATAESCTAGMLSGRLTEVAGASAVFECGIAAYSNDIKHQMLGVPQSILDEQGAVSPETAGAMAVGVRRISGADIGIGITGVAGPEGSEGKEVGTVYVALADDKRVWVKKVFAGHGAGDREHIRTVSTSYALDMARRYLEALPGVLAGGQPLEPATSLAQPKIKKQPRAVPALFGKHRALWISLLVMALAATAILLYFYVFKPYYNEKAFNDIWAMYAQGEVQGDTVTKYPEGMMPQFQSLYRENADTRGWIQIENTAINYPVMQQKEDGFYDTRNFYKRPSTFGVPHLKTGTEVGGRLMAVYGNNTEDGQMFSELTQYTDIAYLKKHTTVEMNTIYRGAQYKIFAVMIVGTDDRYTDNFDYAPETFASDEDFQYFVAQVRQRSLFDTPVAVEATDKLLMLTTPIDYGFDGARIVVAARQVRVGEAAENDLMAANKNGSVLMPIAWQQQQGSITVTTKNESQISTGTVTETTATQTTQQTETTATQGTTGSATTTTSSTTLSTKPTVTTTTTATQAPTATSTTATTTVTSTTTTTTAVTTTTTVVKPTTPVVSPSGTVTGTVAETEFLKYFAIKNTNTAVRLEGQDAQGVIRPQTKEALQMALASVVKTELGNAATMTRSTEAQKAQAVASYTYILWYNKATGTPYAHNALKSISLSNKYDKMIYDAVGEVVGVKLLDTTKATPSDMLCQAVYNAASGGNTSSSNKVWTGALPYLKSVASPHDNALSYVKYHGTGSFADSVTLSRSDLYAKIQDWFSKNIQSVTGNETCTMPAEQFTNDDSMSPLRALSYDGDGTSGSNSAWNYVYETNFYYLNKKGQKVQLKGHQIRQALGLRSHAFRTSFENDTVTIQTQGWGHGVGLSQMGAVGYANEDGWTYVQILRHYYSVTNHTAHQVVLPVW